MSRITHNALVSNDPKTALIGPPSWARTPRSTLRPPRVSYVATGPPSGPEPAKYREWHHRRPPANHDTLPRRPRLHSIRVGTKGVPGSLVGGGPGAPFRVRG